MNRRILYLHVPKTAGSSLTDHQIFYKKINCTIHAIREFGVWDKITKKGEQDSYKIAFVRNPWDRFVSLYFYFYNMQLDHWAYKWDYQTVKNIRRFKSFEDFCLNFNDFDEAQPFKKFHFYNQCSWTHYDNKKIVDFLGRYESLNQHIRQLETKLNLKHHPLGRQNTSSHDNYTKYYNDKTANLVADMYAKDIKYFNYKFR